MGTTREKGGNNGRKGILALLPDLFVINNFKFCFSYLHSGWNLGISCGEEGIKSASKADILKTDLIFLQQKAENAKIIKL